MNIKLPVLTLLLIQCAPLQAAQSLFDFELRSLTQPYRESLTQYQGKPSLFMFFKADCPCCLRQTRVFNQLLEDCPQSFQPIAIGTQASRRELKKEHRRLKPNFPAYQASGELVSQIGELPGTPFTLLADSQGKPVSWLRGYIPKKRLKRILEKRLGFSCQVPQVASLNEYQVKD